jgi:hypothetical protein
MATRPVEGFSDAILGTEELSKFSMGGLSNSVIGVAAAASNFARQALFSDWSISS